MLKKIQRPKSKTNKSKNQQSGFQRFFNASKNTQHPTKNKSKNNNINYNNSNLPRRSISAETRLPNSNQVNVRTVYSEFPFTTSLLVKNETLDNNAKKVELDDDLLLEINKKFPHFLDINYADAMLKLNYHTSRHLVLIKFKSIENQCKYTLRNIRAIVRIYHNQKKLFEKKSDAVIGELKPKCKEKFRFTIKKKLKNVDVKLIELIINLIGGVVGFQSNQSLVLTSKNANEQILGGAIINLKDHLEHITVE